jgi:hypothetical protein
VIEAADLGLTDAAPVHVRFAAPARRFCCCAQSDPRVSRARRLRRWIRCSARRRNAESPLWSLGQPARMSCCQSVVEAVASIADLIGILHPVGAVGDRRCVLRIDRSSAIRVF